MEFGDGYSCGICFGFHGSSVTLPPGISLPRRLFPEIGKRDQKSFCGANLCLPIDTEFKLC